MVKHVFSREDLNQLISFKIKTSGAYFDSLDHVV